MIADETAMLLTWLSEADGRYRSADAEGAATKVRVWTDLLGDVPYDFALTTARRYYGQIQEKMLSPGTIRTAWLGEQRREDARVDRERQTAERQVAAILPGMDGVKLRTSMPTWFPEQLRKARAALVAGQDPADPAVLPSPPGLSTVVHLDSREARERRCGNPDCHCTHTECRGGFLDNEKAIDGTFGTYHAAQVCPICREAREMRAELNPRRGRSRRR